MGAVGAIAEGQGVSIADTSINRAHAFFKLDREAAAGTNIMVHNSPSVALALATATLLLVYSIRIANSRHCQTIDGNRTLDFERLDAGHADDG